MAYLCPVRFLAAEKGAQLFLSEAQRSRGLLVSFVKRAQYQNNEPKIREVTDSHSAMFFVKER